MIEERIIKKIFYILLIASLLVFFISIPLTHYISLRLYVWKEGSSFYDFFTCLKGNIYWKRYSLYADGTIYPPLANLFYVFITRFMSIETLKQMETLTDYNKIKALQECSLYFILYCNITLLAYHLVISAWKKGNYTEKTFFSVIMLFSVPFIYQFERANIIFVSLILSMMFFLWKDSKNTWKRIVAYLSLAIAAGVKIYPAIYGVLILKEKKYKDASFLVFTGAALFLIPFIFFGRFENVFLLIRNIQATAEDFTASRIGYQLDYATILKFVFGFVGRYNIYLSYSVKFIFIILGCWAVFGHTDKWKSVLLLTCMIIGIPSISYVYAAIFMIIPIVVYLDSGDKKKSDLIYLVGMILVMIPLPFVWLEGSGDKYYSYMHISTPVIIESIALILMTIMLIIDGLYSFCKNIKIRVFSVMGIVLVVLFSFGINRDTIQAAYSYTDYLSKTLSDQIIIQDGDVVEQSFTPNEKKLEYIILKLNPTRDGSIMINIRNDERGIIDSVILDMGHLRNGYNKITFENCMLIPNEQYILEIIAQCKKDEKVKLGRTIEYLDTGNEFFLLNRDQLQGALSIQIFESNKGG